jgi:hypothetical protein
MLSRKKIRDFANLLADQPNALIYKWLRDRGEGASMGFLSQASFEMALAMKKPDSFYNFLSDFSNYCGIKLFL